MLFRLRWTALGDPDSGPRHERSHAGIAAAAAVLLAAAAVSLVSTPLPAAGAESSALTFAQPCGNTGAPGDVHHVIWIWMENESYSTVIGNPATPYQNALASQCGLAGNFYNESHGSLANYVAATDGQSALNTSFVTDCLPNAAAGYCVSSNASIFSQADSAGGGWASYEESMPTDCDSTDPGGTSDLYGTWHNPAVYYPTLGDCATDDVPMGNETTLTGAFYTAVQNATLPAFTFITPNLVDDAHNSSPAAGDSWLSQIIPFIVNGPNYQAGDTTIFITDDEGTGADEVANEDCANPNLASSQPSCHIPTIVVAPYIPAGTLSSTFYTHYSMLRTAEELLGYPLLGQAQHANSMTAGFNLGSITSVPPISPTAPANLTASVIGPTQVDLGWTASVPGSGPISGYEVERDGTVIATTTSTSYADTSLSAATSYSYSVQAVDDSYNTTSPASNVVQVTTPPAGSGSSNLLPNPGFETWSNGRPAGWTTYGPDTSLTQSSNSHSGSYSVGVATASGGYAASGVSAGGTTPLVNSTTAGVTYAGSCWVKVSKAITVNIQLHEETPKWVSVSPPATASLAISTTTSWYQITVSYTTVRNGDILPFSIFSTNTKSGGATFEVDDCSLTSPSSTSSSSEQAQADPAQSTQGRSRQPRNRLRALSIAAAPRTRTSLLRRARIVSS
jgi:hypothetical protein